MELRKENQETWKDIKGYEGLYKISNTGKIKNLLTNGILVPIKYKTDGLGMVVLTKGNDSKYIDVEFLINEHFSNDLQLENWKDIEGYEGLYKISDFGKIFNINTNSFVEIKNEKVDENGNEISVVYLFKKGFGVGRVREIFKVDDLVAKHFLAGYVEGCKVIHLDNDYRNNNVNNLCIFKEVSGPTIDNVDNIVSSNKEDTTVECEDIKTTTDYSMFKWLEGNRNINEVNKYNLIDNINKNGYIGSPIIVNENMEIIDGQHRYEACKYLGVPIPYIVVEGLTIKDVITMNNSGRKWKNIDYITSNMNEKNNPNNYETYQFIYNLLMKYNNSLTIESIILLIILAKKTDDIIVRNELKKSTLTISKSERNTINDIVDKILDFGLEYPKAEFIRAFYKLYNMKEYNHNVMLKKIDSYGYKIKKTGTDKLKAGNTETYSTMLSDLYNMNNRKNCIYYSKELGYFVDED